MIWRNSIITPVKTVVDSIDTLVSLDEARHWLKMDNIGSDDLIITSLIKAATGILQRSLSMSFMARTLSVYFIHGECFPFHVPYGPVITINSLTRRECDCQGMPFTPFTGYDIAGDSFSGPNGYYNMEYVAGPVSTVYPDNVEALKTMLLQQIAWMYENRGDQRQQQLNPIIDIYGASMTQNDWI